MKIKFGTRKISEAACRSEMQSRKELLKNEESKIRNSERGKEIKNLLINRDLANFN